MTKEDLLKLKYAIASAIDVGEKAAAEHTDDSGSCNLDVVAIKMKGIRTASIERAGLPGHIAAANTRHERRLYVPTPFSGQANRRTYVVEAMAKHLKDQGIDCYVHYQID